MKVDPEFVEAMLDKAERRRDAERRDFLSRRRGYTLSYEMLMAYFLGRPLGDLFAQPEVGVPENAILVHIDYSNLMRTFTFYVCHDTFDPVPEGSMTPTTPIVFSEGQRVPPRDDR